MKLQQIKSTRNYAQFKLLNANRAVDDAHVDRLIKSMKENYLPIPIYVNEHLEIIDGQHRYEAIRQLGLELYYIISEGADISAVQKLNTNSKNWTSSDFLDSYIKLGKQEYINFKKYMDTFGFDITTCAVILMGNVGNKRLSEILKSGSIKLRDLEDAYKFGYELKRVKTYYQNYRRRSFVFAIIALLKSDEFIFEDFIHKLSMQGGALKDCTSTSTYIDLIEEIYNYRRSDKVNLRAFKK